MIASTARKRPSALTEHVEMRGIDSARFHTVHGRLADDYQDDHMILTTVRGVV
jgi:hypothetical protein